MDPLSGLQREGSDVTYLRPERNSEKDPLIYEPQQEYYRHVGRNPYFYYQHLIRTGNSVTTHSNVYATWITVGYFEVNPETGQLGQELNTETGEIKRHRAFYLMDRSIPVGYEPGKNHNVDRAITLRRFIE